MHTLRRGSGRLVAILALTALLAGCLGNDAEGNDAEANDPTIMDPEATEDGQ